MKSIEITTISGKKVSGEWNEKFYPSKKDGYKFRVYINNTEYHLTDSEYKRLCSEGEKEKDKFKWRTCQNIETLFERLSKEDRLKCLVSLAHDLRQSMSGEDKSIFNAEKYKEFKNTVKLILDGY